MNSSNKKEFTFTEAIRLLGVSRSTFYRAVNEREIEIIKYGDGEKRVTLQAILLLQEKKGWEPLDLDGEILNFHSMTQKQQVDILAYRTDYLQYSLDRREILQQKADLENKIKALQLEISFADQHLRKLDHIFKRDNTAFVWPNQFLGITVKNIPLLRSDPRYQQLVKEGLIDDTYRPGFDDVDDYD